MVVLSWEWTWYSQYSKEASVNVFECERESVCVWWGEGEQLEMKSERYSDVSM